MEAVTVKPDNRTVAKRLPYEGRRTLYYATFYGQILYWNKLSGKWGVKGYPKHHYSPATRRKGVPYRKMEHRGVLSNMYVHRLVAMAWLPYRDMFHTQVDHVDNNKFNNRASNLRWCSNLENKRFASAIKRGEIIITNLQKSLFYAY